MSQFVTLSTQHVINLDYVSLVKFCHTTEGPFAKVFFSDGKMLEVSGEEYEVVRNVWPNKAEEHS